MNLSTAEKRMLIDQKHSKLSVADQCHFLGIARSSYYREPSGETLLNLELMHRIDELRSDLEIN